MKYKVMIILFILVLLLLGSGMTYSIFNSEAQSGSIDQNIAKFIFNAQDENLLHLSLVDLNPGDMPEYPFSITNSNAENTSDVAVEYQMTIKTYHLVPLIIKLYKIDSGIEELILDCDETFSRNAQNELICNAPVQSMNYDAEILDDYKIKVEFPTQYDDIKYSNLVDYIDVTIKSWQKQ